MTRVTQQPLVRHRSDHTEPKERTKIENIMSVFKQVSVGHAPNSRHWSVVEFQRFNQVFEGTESQT